MASPQGFELKTQFNGTESESRFERWRFFGCHDSWDDAPGLK